MQPLLPSLVVIAFRDSYASCGNSLRPLDGSGVASTRVHRKLLKPAPASTLAPVPTVHTKAPEESLRAVATFRYFAGLL